MEYEVGDLVRINNRSDSEYGNIYPIVAIGENSDEIKVRLTPICSKWYRKADLLPYNRVKEKIEMKYKVGDRVRVHNIHWFEVNCTTKANGDYIMPTYGRIFTRNMFRLCGHIVTITDVCSNFYRIKEDGYCWDDDMFEMAEQNNNNRIGNSNIIADLCKSLDISIGQIIVSNDSGYKYRLTETYGLEVFEDGDWKVCGSYFNTFIKMLQEYKFATKWIPKDNEKIYYVDFYNENLYNYMFYNPENEHFKNLLDCNMLYKTKQEAVEAAKKYMNQMKGEY